MADSDKIYLIDETFQSQHAAICELFVQLTSSRISFGVVDRETEQLKALFDSPFESTIVLKAILDHHPLLALNYQTVKVACESFKFTFIPSSFYCETEAASYARVINASPEEITTTDIQGPQIKNISTIDPELREILKKKFRGLRLFNTANPIIEAASRLYKGETPCLVLNFNDHSFEAVLLNKGRVAFYNLFSIGSPDDFNYYLLFIARELSLDTLQVKLLLAGQVSILDPRYLRLKKYFRNISFAESGMLINSSPVLQKLPGHLFFSLISLNLCE